MPFVVSTAPGTDLESLELDGLSLNDAILGLAEFSCPPPRQRQQWIGAADSEHQVLVGDPLHENRTITAKIAVAPAADMDGALTRIAQVVDKLQAASKDPDGIELLWNPAGSTITSAFDVLAGEITDLPIDWENGWLAKAPTITIVMIAKPYERDVVNVSIFTAATSSTPFVALEIPDVPGDVPALGRFVVRDNASKARRHLEWGLEGPQTYDPSTSLIVDSDDLLGTADGYAGVQVTLTGAYNPDAAGPNAVGNLTATSPQAMLGLPNLSHVGSFRVKARLMTNVTGMHVRLAYKTGDGPLSTTPWLNPPIVDLTGAFNTWGDLELGTITIPRVKSGLQMWTGRLEAYSDAGGEVYVDYFTLIPVGAGYGKARAAFTYSPGVQVAADDFTGTAAGANLSTSGNWATSGSTTDFQYADDLGGEQLKRATVSDTGERRAIYGAADYTNTTVQTSMRFSVFPTSPAVTLEQGVIARSVDSSNYLRATLRFSAFKIHELRIVKQIAGVDTSIASKPLPMTVFDPMLQNATTFVSVRLTVFDSGRAIAELFDTNGTTVLGTAETTDTVLATGGTLQTGKPGIYDRDTTTPVITRYYDNFEVSIPTAEPLVMYSGRTFTVNGSDVYREDATATYTGAPNSYRGSPFRVPVGTSRLLVKARRDDVDVVAEANVTDSTTVTAFYTPRYLVVPR